MTIFGAKIHKEFITTCLRIADRVGATIMMGVLSYGATQVRELYKSVNLLNQNVAVIAERISSQGNEIQDLKETVRYLQRRK